MFGMFNHISFPNGGDPQDEGYSHIETAEGCATVSDSSGNLLFYSEGVNCWAYKSGTGPSNIGRGFGGMGGIPTVRSLSYYCAASGRWRRLAFIYNR